MRFSSRCSRGALLVALCFASLSAFAQSPGQTVRGQVVDRATQAPLPGANVFVLNTDPLLGTMTDADGWFVLDGVPLGRQDLQVRFLGFVPRTLPQVLVTAGKEVVLHVALEEEVLAGDEVVVVAEVHKDQALNDLATVSARAFSVEETRRYAGGLDDPARMASAFAGVATGGSLQENAMIIRGNAPKGVQWRLEGVPIPNPNHFAGLTVAGGGGLTLFSSQLLADSDFLTGAFPAEYGDALAGVFDMRFRTGNRAQREHTLQVGALGVEVASEGPFVKGQPATYLFNYRYSTLGLLLPLLPTEDVATYQDLSFKLDVPTRRWGRFSLWGLGGLDRQTTTATEDSTQWEYEAWDRLDGVLDLGVGAAGLSHHLILGSRSLLQTTAAATINHTDWHQQRLGDDLQLHDDQLIRSTRARLIVSTALNHKFSSRHTNRSGVSAQGLFYDLDLQAAPEPEASPVPVARGDGRSALVQFFSQSKFGWGTRWTANLGLHGQYFALTGQTVLEPRAGLRWAFRAGQALSAGYGLHSQVEALPIYLVQQQGRPNRDLGLTRAHHFVLGYDRRLHERARLRLEGYYQHLFDVPVVADSSYSLLNFTQDFAFSEALVNEGLGRNYGVELTLERFLHDGWYYLVTGSVFRARYRGGDGVWRATRFDRGYAANALFGKEWTLRHDHLLSLNGRLSLTGGARRSPIDAAASLAAEEVIYDEDRAFAVREPAFFGVDLTVTYRRNHTRVSEVWALQVKNVLAAQNVSWAYNYQTNQVAEVKEGFPLPVLSYKLEF